MISFTMRLEPDLLQRAKDRAGLIPLSRIIRILIEKWLAGEINIAQTLEKDE